MTSARKTPPPTSAGLMRDALAAPLWPSLKLTLAAIASRHDVATGEATVSIEELAELTGHKPQESAEHILALLGWRVLRPGSGPEHYILRLPMRLRSRDGSRHAPGVTTPKGVTASWKETKPRVLSI